MNRPLDPTFDQRLADWLEDDPSTAPREVLHTVLAAYPSIDQRRASRAPWRNPLMNRYLLPLAAALIVVIGAVYIVIRPASTVGPPASATIEGTWEVTFTRQEMLAAGITDQGEDNPGNYGHFRLTLKAGTWKMDQLSPTAFDGGLATYTAAAGIVHLYSPNDDVTFDLPYTVTDTTLTIGRGGPVTFRVKPWTRVADQALPTEVPGSPLKVGSFDGPVVKVADIIAAMNADSALTAADRTKLLDEIMGIRNKTTFRVSIFLLGGRFTERETIDGTTIVGSFGRYSFPNPQTLVFTESINGADVLTTFDLTVDGDSFTLHRTSAAPDKPDDFVTRTLFESGPFVLR